MLVDKTDLGFGKAPGATRCWSRRGIKKMFIEPEVEGDPFEVSDADTMLEIPRPEREAAGPVVILRARLPVLHEGEEDPKREGLDFEEVPLPHTSRNAARDRQGGDGAAGVRRRQAHRRLGGARELPREPRALTAMDVKARPKASEIEAQKLPYPAKQSECGSSRTATFRTIARRQADRQAALITGGDSRHRPGRRDRVRDGRRAGRHPLQRERRRRGRDQGLVEAKGGRCHVIKHDVRSRTNALPRSRRRCASFGRLDILVNNAAFQMSQRGIRGHHRGAVGAARSRPTFSAISSWPRPRCRIWRKGDPRSSTPADRRHDRLAILIDYTATKGAIHAFTKSPGAEPRPQRHPGECVVPGPVWTPNIPGTMPASEVENFGHEVILQRPGQPEELAPAYVLLASSDGSFMTGALVEVTGGRLSAAA